MLCIYLIRNPLLSHVNVPFIFKPFWKQEQENIYMIIYIIFLSFNPLLTSTFKFVTDDIATLSCYESPSHFY